MTNEQAIRILRAHMYGEPDMPTILVQAIEKAIEAIEQRQVVEEWTRVMEDVWKL